MKHSQMFWTFGLVFLLFGGLDSRLVSRDLNDDADKYLLPWNIRPEHYDLTLYTHIEHFQDGVDESFVFMGIAEITVLVLYGDVDEVVIHSADNTTFVSVDIVSLEGETPQDYKATVGSYDPETNKQSILVDPPLLNNGRYRLTIYYIGLNNEVLRGFYRSSFQDENGNKRWLVTTHFESFGARMAFPSFDEPEYKATYKLTIHYNQTLAEQGYRAFFNTEIESEEIKNGVHITTFKTTPRPLSSYLVAFIVAPFASSPVPAYFNSSFNGENALKPFHTIGQPKYFSPRQDLLSQVAGPAALNTMTQLTGVGFGLDKVEQAGIPDFGPGAMENWGLVTYRETAVFWSNETGTSAQKQSVMSTITHELAHQWFGDLVTLHWWTDVWLNEGFATFFAVHAADLYREPDLNTADWNLVGQFVTGTLQKSAFVTDAKPTSRPLTAEAYLPATIDSYFDGISYDKGGSVLRMWLHALGPSIFYSGLNRYLKQQEEGVGTPEILLASWDGVIDSLPSNQKPDLPATIAELFQGWHLQAGYPVIDVRFSGTTLSITQERFLSSAGESTSRWNVPISYSTSAELNFNDTSPYAIFEEDVDILALGVKPADWVVVNNQQTGYYRVNYDSENWEKLIAIVNDPNAAQQIHEYNRAQILDDAENLGAAYKNYLPYTVSLRILNSLRHERSFIVWNPALRMMRKLLSRLESQPETQLAAKTYFKWLIEPIFNELGGLYTRDSDAHTDKLLRVEVAKMACLLDLPACKVQAQNLKLSRSVHPDVQEVLACERVRRGGEAETEEVLREVVGGVQLSDKSNLIAALACTQDDATLVKSWDSLQKSFGSESPALLPFVKAYYENHPGKSTIALPNKWSSIDGKEARNLLLSSLMADVDIADTESARSGETRHAEWLKANHDEVADWLNQVINTQIYVK